MKQEKHLITDLFGKFVKASSVNKRTKPSGKRLSAGTKANYENLLRLLLQHQKHKGYFFYISPAALYNKRYLKKQQMDYKKFYTSFTGYLFDEKKLFDNYVGTQIKNLKVFFNWLNLDYGIHTGEFYKKFYVWKEEIPEPEIGYYLGFRPPINSKFQLRIRKQ